MKKTIAFIVLLCISFSVLCGCSGKTTQETTAPTSSAPLAAEAALPDGIYRVDFHTDSSMFHVNEACEGKATLTVENGKMTVHATLVSKSILNLFVGTAEDAAKEGALLLQPTEDSVTYKDGFSETVYGFDIPIEKLDSDFALAIIGKKGTWYDHTVSVSNPEPMQ